MVFPRTVYAIQHNATKKIYIGSSADVPARYWNHIYRLRKGKHIVKDMQDDFDIYGEDYSLFILDEIRNFSEKEKEYEWMNKYKTGVRGIGYNYKDKAKNKINKRNVLPLVSGKPKEVT